MKYKTTKKINVSEKKLILTKMMKYKETKKETVEINVGEKKIILKKKTKYKAIKRRHSK